MLQNRLKIGDIADLLGITTKTIRHYHAIGLLPEADRDANGYRLYSIADIRRLQEILRLQGLGLSLKQIHFIVGSDEPSKVLARVLQHNEQRIAREMEKLRQQQLAIQEFLEAGHGLEHLTPDPPDESSADILFQTIRPASLSLAETLYLVESNVLSRLDRMSWSESHTDFWVRLAEGLRQFLLPHEHQVILWMERYLTLAQLNEDDRQAHAWLMELKYSQDRAILCQIWRLPEENGLSVADQQHIEQLLPMLLLEDSSPLQQRFLQVLME